MNRRNLEKRKGIKFAFAEPDPDKVIVSMLEFQDKVYVATKKGVYKIKDDTLVRLKFVDKTKESENEQA